MSEQEQVEQSESAAGEETPEGAEGTDSEAADGTDAATGDADAPATATEGQGASTVTDLPEGAEVDPLTDQRPEPVVESETHGE